MRIALISDLHANLVALDAVLADAAAAGAERVICLGDVVSLGPDPRETLARLRDAGIPCVQGNHDPLPPNPPCLAELEAWCEARLTPEEREWLRALPSRLEVPLDPTTTLLCVHGSPRSYDEQVLAETSDAALDAMLDGHPAAVTVCGHTHVQLLRRVRDRLVVNVGSVGMPFVEAYHGHGEPQVLPWAEYAIVAFEGGRLGVDLRRVPFDFQAFAERVRASGMPAGEAWLGQWVRGAGSNGAA
jgi:putative phosphoesterase